MKDGINHQFFCCCFFICFFFSYLNLSLFLWINITMIYFLLFLCCYCIFVLIVEWFIESLNIIFSFCFLGSFFFSSKFWFHKTSLGDRFACICVFSCNLFLLRWMACVCYLMLCLYNWRKKNINDFLFHFSNFFCILFCLFLKWWLNI